MANCDTCQWHRPITHENNTLTILASLIGSPQPEVSSKLDALEATEFGKFDAERQEARLKEMRAECVLGQIGANFYGETAPASVTDKELDKTITTLPYLFDGEPKCVSHCVAPSTNAQPGDRRVWSIPSLRNWAGRCGAYKTRPPAKDCIGCAHYVAPRGDVEDEETIARLNHLLGQAEGHAGGMVQQEIDKLLRSIGPTKALELEMAYNAEGRLGKAMRYLPYCARFKAIPEIWNQFGDCEGFKAAVKMQPAPRAQASGHGSVSGSVSGFATRSVSSEAATRKAPDDGASSSLSPLPDRPLSNEQTTLEKHGASPFGKVRSGVEPPWMHPRLARAGKDALDAVAGLACDRLVDLAQRAAAGGLNGSGSGAPPLTSEMLERSAAAAAVAYGRPLSADEQSIYVAHVRTAWRRNLSRAIDAQLKLMARGHAISHREAAAHLREFISAAAVMRPAANGRG